MKIYLISLAAGMLVGSIYGLLNVRSPAPPVVALIGLAGILIGEQCVPLAKQWWTQGPVSAAVVSAHLKSHSLATLPAQSPDCSQAQADCRSPRDKG